MSKVRGAAAERERPFSFRDDALRFPELKQTVLTVCGDEVLVGVVGDANHILLMDRQCSLQFAGDCAEAVEHKVFTHTIDPLTTRRQSAAHKVTTFSLTRAETPHDLSLHVHDDHCVGAVTHYKVLWVLGQQDNVVHCDVCAGRRAERFEGAAALCGLHVPHLDCTIRGSTNDVMAIGSEGGLINE